ncbi:MAG: hypothetical protein IKS96_00595 [Fibrobacter sp.]|nr:hypothetical protein [Fibrobacter sp.]
MALITTLCSGNKKAANYAKGRFLYSQAGGAFCTACNCSWFCLWLVLKFVLVYMRKVGAVHAAPIFFVHKRIILLLA